MPRSEIKWFMNIAFDCAVSADVVTQDASICEPKFPAKHSVTHFMSQESVVHASLRLAHGPEAKGTVIATSSGSEGIDWKASGTSSPDNRPGFQRRNSPNYGAEGTRFPVPIPVDSRLGGVLAIVLNPAFQGHRLGARSAVEIEGRHVGPMRACRGGLQQPGLRAFPDGQELRFSGPSPASGGTRRDSSRRGRGSGHRLWPGSRVGLSPSSDDPGQLWRSLQPASGRATLSRPTWWLARCSASHILTTP